MVLRYYAAGTLLAAGLLLFRGQRLRAGLALGLLLAVFLPTGWHWRNYEPVCEDRFFYAETEMLHELKSCVGEQRVAILGEDSIPPMANLAWRINLLSNYDGIWVRDFDKLYRQIFGDTYNWRPIVKGSGRGLQLMATPWVLAKWNWNFLDSGLSAVERGESTHLVRQEILPGHEARQVFKCHENNLQVVEVYLSAYPQFSNRKYQFRLYEVETGRLVSEQAFTTDEVRSTIYTREQSRFPLDRGAVPLGREFVFLFAPEADSRGKRYRYVIAAQDGQPGDCLYAWSFNVRAYGEGEAQMGDATLPGEMWFDFSYNQDRFELVKQIGEYGLYRYKDALPVFHAVGGAVHAEDERECLALLHSPLLDLRNMVVINDQGSSPGSPARAPANKDAGRLIKVADSVKVYYVLNDGKSMVWIENEAMFLANKFRWEDVETVPQPEFERFAILKEASDLARELGLNTVAPVEKEGSEPVLLEQGPTYYRMKITRANPGWLVISQARYPGWKARVDGKEVPLLRANFAFNALALPRGESQIEFSYEPLSLRRGFWISGLSALIGLVLLWRLARARPALANSPA